MEDFACDASGVGYRSFEVTALRRMEHFDLLSARLLDLCVLLCLGSTKPVVKRCTLWRLDSRSEGMSTDSCRLGWAPLLALYAATMCASKPPRKSPRQTAAQQRIHERGARPPDFKVCSLGRDQRTDAAACSPLSKSALSANP